MVVLCDDFDIELVRAIRHDGKPADIVPLVKMKHQGRQTAEYVSWHIADQLKMYAEHSGTRPWRQPMQFDIRVIRVDNGCMVYSILPEFSSWLQKTMWAK